MQIYPVQAWQPLLLGLTNQFEWNTYLLVDESHNLIERGRSMYSAELHRADLLGAKKSAPAAIKKNLGKINNAWLALLKTLPDLIYFLYITKNQIFVNLL